jgi:hypothetical protein
MYILTVCNIKSSGYFTVLLLFNFFAHSQILHINYTVSDSLFSKILTEKLLLPDSLPTLSLSPLGFKAYINDLQQKQRLCLDTFALQNALTDTIYSLLVAKITYQNLTNLLKHPLDNNFFEVQQNEQFTEEIKSFYRQSYHDYSLFLDTIQVSCDDYLLINEYIIFLDSYLDYQEIRFHVFNTVAKCTPFDRYWLIRLLFMGEVRNFMANKEWHYLQENYAGKLVEKLSKKLYHLPKK